MKALPAIFVLLLAACGGQQAPPLAAPSLIGIGCASSQEPAGGQSRLKTKGETTCIAT